jgi:hypothetical protein
LNCLVAFDEILCGGDDIENDLDSITLNPLNSTISKWQAFKILRCTRILNRLVELDEILYGRDGIEHYLDYIIFNPIASTTLKWRTFKLLRLVLILNRWRIWMKFCMEMMTLNMTSTRYYLIVQTQPFQNCGHLNFLEVWKFELLGGFGWNFVWKWWRRSYRHHTT